MLKTCTTIAYKCPDDSSEATPTTTETNTPERQSILLKTAARQRLLPLKPARPIFLSIKRQKHNMHARQTYPNYGQPSVSSRFASPASNYSRLNNRVIQLALRVWPAGVVLADPSNSNGFGGHMSSSRAAVYRALQHRSRSASVCLVFSDLTELPSFSHGLSTQHFFRRGQTIATC